MCRFMVYCGPPVRLDRVLYDAPFGLVKQSSHHHLPKILHPSQRKIIHLRDVVDLRRVNSILNVDGTGVGWYGYSIEDGDQNPTQDKIPFLFTTRQPLWSSINLRRLAPKLYGNIIFGHVRAASPGSPCHEFNCHPFQIGRFLFMHNGAVAQWNRVFPKVLSNIEPSIFPYMKGTTDSEVVFGLFCSNLPRGPFSSHSSHEIRCTLLATISQLMRIVYDSANAVETGMTSTTQTSTLLSSGEFSSTASSLNFAISDGCTTIVTRYRSDLTQDPPSLYFTEPVSLSSIKNTGCLCLKKYDPSTKPPRRPSFFISSEPITPQYDLWRLVPNNNLVIFNCDHSITQERMHVGTAVERFARKWVRISLKRELKQNFIGLL